MINLENYLSRIGFDRKPAIDLKTLQDIILCHTRTIPFENLNPFTGRPVDIALGAVEEKLVKGHRGGYCFEQNRLLEAALAQIGFRKRALAARVVYNQPPDAISPFTHKLLLVELDGESYLLDAGFGSMTPTGPLRLRADLVQPTPHEDFRLLQDGKYYRLEAAVKGEWKALYKFHLEEHYDEDFRVMNWYTSCHPASHFTFTLIAARSFDGGRYALRNRELNIHYLDRPSEKIELEEPGAVKRVLSERFHLNISEISDLDRHLKRLFPK